MGASQQFSLRWNNYLRHITCAFDSLRNDENLVDVTLSCEGKKIRAHRMLLSACSTYFQELFKENPCQHPVVIFRNVKFEDLSALVDFMYQGEVNVIQEQLSSFLATAELLAIQGLSDGNGRDQNLTEKESEMLDTSSLSTEPETQSSNSHTQPVVCDVSSPISFFPLDQTCDSPPSNKRRKCATSASGNAINIGSASNTIQKDTETRTPERERRRNKTSVETNQDSVEIIPVLPNLKVEMPDYDEDDPDASSCSYDDSSHGPSLGGALSAVSRLLPSSSASTSNTKPEPSEMYSPNSRDGSESLSATDIGHILSKPGSSGENQSQESLQDSVMWVGDPGKHRSQSLNKGPSKEYHCNICEKAFQNVDSLYKHKDVHKGKTQCPICQILLSRMHHLKRHMLCRHGIKLSDIVAPS